MLSQGLGGRTANMEFEALTGRSVSQFPRQAQVPYQAIIPDYATFPSAAAGMKNRNHRTVAIHPNLPQLYRRRDVYRFFDFDEFVYDRTMHVDDRIGHDAWISDQAAFDELMLTLEQAKQALFMNLVTMQNTCRTTGATTTDRGDGRGW
jgi:phosphoglycerol transferase MdoB-like AlkP superfamily enzyme